MEQSSHCIHVCLTMTLVALLPEFGGALLLVFALFEAFPPPTTLFDPGSGGFTGTRCLPPHRTVCMLNCTVSLLPSSYKTSCSPVSARNDSMTALKKVSWTGQKTSTSLPMESAPVCAPIVFSHFPIVSWVTACFPTKRNDWRHFFAEPFPPKRSNSVAGHVYSDILHFMSPESRRSTA